MCTHHATRGACISCGTILGCLLAVSDKTIIKFSEDLHILLLGMALLIVETVGISLVIWFLRVRAQTGKQRQTDVYLVVVHRCDRGPSSDVHLRTW